MKRISRSEGVWLALILAALLVIYLPSLGNGLVFDDAYLTSGLFDDYHSLAIRARMFSYGSFVWLHALFGDGWWKQRLVNLVIHAGVVLALWGLYRQILAHIEPAAPEAIAPTEARPRPIEDRAALGFALGFFALNPVAVYAVAYLIERSILLATFFVVLGLWVFAIALSERKPWLHVLVLACYVLAIASKEHAVLAPVAAVPLYIIIARPAAKRIAVVSFVGAILVGIAALVLARRYGDILGKPFDEYSRVYLAQLAQLNPDATRHAFALSILNEAWLFFRYGFEWFVPYAGWMSIELRPPFPVTWLSFPQVLGVAGYAAVVIGGFVLVLRYRDWRALLGISLLIPALLFATEFATVWVQDPFVLYRSYLWAIGVPGLVFVAIHGTPWRALLPIGVAIAALFVWQGVDRVFSLRSPESAWSDAIAKLPDDPRSVGRWFPYLNRGGVYVDRNDFQSALRDFEISSRLGDLGMGSFNAASVLTATGHPAEALVALDRAEKEGYDLYNLPFQRGLALMALGKAAEAYQQFEIARAKNPPSPTRELVLLNLGRTALQLGRKDEAAQALEQLLAVEPSNVEAQYLLGMTYLTRNEAARAKPLLDNVVAKQPSARAYYARAMVNYALKQKAQSLEDIDNALRFAPGNPTLQQWEARIRAMP